MLPFWLSTAIVYLCAAGVVLIDQVLKRLLPDVLLNQGVAFGVAAGWGGVPGMTALLLVVLFAWLSLVAQRQQWSWWGWAAIGMIVGGGFSNIVDRVLTGAVRDPLTIPFTHIQNNVADYAIFLGVVLVFVASFVNGEGEEDTV